MPKLVVFSGAGLSAESGIPTFRDDNGLWAQYDPMEVCNYENWEENYALVHSFYNKRRAELAAAKPNAMHFFLASLQEFFQSIPRAYKKPKPIEVIHITQNIDDLLERAGIKDAMHIHGELTKITCPRCKCVLEIGYQAFDMRPCGQCGYERMKPKVVFFYEQAPLYAKMYEVFSSLGAQDCVLVIGTSGSVVDISMILARAESSYNKIGRKILNNLAKSKTIAESVFDVLLYKPATQAIQDIEQELTIFFKEI